jgi:hypothetical protein
MEHRGASRSSRLIAEPGGDAPSVAAQFADLRGLEVRSYAAGGGAGSTPSARLSLIATSFATFAAMSPRDREQLHATVEAGATLYLRGAFAGNRYQLAPLVDSTFSVVTIPQPRTYRFTLHPLIPGVLRGEETPFADALSAVSDLSGDAQPLLLARDHNDAEFPVVFAYRIGRGALICDVQPDTTTETPLIWRLADPLARCANISALIAVDRAAGRDVSRPVPFNLTIDDVPLAYDYFNESRLEEFLDYLERRCAGTHLDCAWIPSSQRMSRRYVEILKSHGVGFLWHGIHQHVDHQKIDNPGAEMEIGKRAMAGNVERYGVRLQPLIIFPYERAHSSAERLLLNEGFIAGAEQPRNEESATETPPYLQYCEAWCAHESGLRFLHRYEAPFLTRDRMLAIAAMGMPILAFAHPKDVRLRRLSRFVERGGTYAHFDEVLDFAAAKNLPGQSLEEIARAVLDTKTASAIAA